jgi:hypothetical protein
MYKVVKHLPMQWMSIWMHPYFWAFMADSGDSRGFANKESVLFPSTYVLAVTCLSGEKCGEELSSKR